MRSNSRLCLHAAISFLSPFSFLSTLRTKCLEIFHSDTDSISFDTPQFLAVGKSGIVYGIDHERILKEFQESDRGEVERRVYERLGSHPNITKLLDIRKDGSLILERGEVLRTICRSPSANNIPIQKKFRWLKHAAEGYQHMHNCGIVHGDVGCHNMILTKKGYLKIIDFEGCSINNEPADSCYEWFSYRPSMPWVSRRTDIFAFGCAIYEIITGKPPYYDEFEASDDRYREVGQLYTNNRFPDVMSLPLGWLIQGCWHGDFNSMNEIIQELDLFL